MLLKNQFSKYATQYGSYNVIQQIVSKALVRDIVNYPSTVLELGCGSGQIFKYINWNFDSYIALDSSQQMCDLHPKHKNLTIKCCDFDSDEFFQFIQNKTFDMILSSSAMQWSKDIDKLLKSLSKSSTELNVVLFTSNTFKSIYKITQITSPILDLDTIKTTFDRYFDCAFELFNYNLEFDNKKQMFDYIKNSGVSSSSSLAYKDAKRLYKEYDLNYLEFEVIFIKAFSKS